MGTLKFFCALLYLVLQRMGKFLLVGNIDAAAHIALESAIRRKAWSSVYRDPAINVILPFQPVLKKEILALIKELAIKPTRCCDIIGMNAFHPAVAGFLLHGAACKIKPPG